MNTGTNTDTHPKKYSIHNVWQKVDPLLANNIANFWIDNQAITDLRLAIDRSKNAVFLARDENGNIVGVSTAYKKRNPAIDHVFYYMRAFVQPDFRDLDIGRVFTLAIISFFELQFITGVDREAIGIFLEVDNGFFIRQRRHAILPEGNFVYVGKNEKGAHLRVRYFQGAQV